MVTDLDSLLLQVLEVRLRRSLSNRLRVFVLPLLPSRDRLVHFVSCRIMHEYV